MDEQQFVQLLGSLLEPDTERVKSATATLNKNYYPQPASLNGLLHILCSHPSKELRQLAAVEARKLVSKHWDSIPSDQKPQFREQLLRTTLNEEVTLVRHSSARVISAIAKLDLEEQQWQDLPSILQQAATSQTVRHREVGVYIIYTIIETMGYIFADDLSDLFVLFGQTIQDPESSEVRINTMLSLSRIALQLDPDADKKSLKAFQNLIPSMVAILKATIEAGDEAQALQAFEVFQTLLGCETALLQKHFGDLVKFMMELAAQTEIDDDIRSQALAFLMQCARFRKLKLQALRIGEQLTLKALQIVTELGDLSSDEEEITPARSALGLLDILASSLPPSQVVVPLLKAIGPYVTAQDPDYRRAGILALGMCVEGAPDFIATQLNEILPMVLHLLEDPSVKVRAAALNGVARLADDLAEDMGKEHSRLIPALVKNFDLAINATTGPDTERNLEIVRGSCNAIDSLIEGLDEQDASKYLPELVPRLIGLFQHPDFKSKFAAVGAVGAIAAASEGGFLPYFEGVMQALAPYITLKESQEDLDLRGQVCDAMGNIASAVGAESFGPYVRPLMEASEEALHLDHPRLRETSYIFWSTMAKVYEEKFSEYLKGVVQGLHECLQQEEEFEIELGKEASDIVGAEVVIAGTKVKVAAATDDDDTAIGIDDTDDDDDWDDLGTVTAVAMEKEIAIEVVGDVITHTRRHYLEHLEQTVGIILKLVEHSYEGVRKAAIGTLWRAYASLWGLAEDDGSMEKWKPGLPLQVAPTTDLAKLGNLVMDVTLKVWQDEIDRGTVTDINRDLAATLRACGPAFLVTGESSVVPKITDQVVAILTKRHPCQQDIGDQFDESILEESSEYDWLVIETALDMVTALAAALGPSFGELWQKFEKPVLKYVSSQEGMERSSAVGSIGDCIAHMQHAVTPYTSSLTKVLLHRLSDEHRETKSNASYAVGLLCEFSTDDNEITKNYSPILMKLEPLLQDYHGDRLLDNAAGCVSRMIVKHPKRVPLGEVLPRLVELLPLKEDYTENRPVYNMIVQLYQAGNDIIRQLTPQLMSVFEKVLSPPEEQLDEETRSHLVELVKFLQAQ